MRNNMYGRVAIFKLILLFLPLIFSCASISQKNRGSEIEREYPNANRPQIGVASWYGIEEHNRYAASGERFSKDAYTAAHRTLPMGTVVRVTNLENGRDVLVKINDRGPFVGNRVIDLSYAAAKSVSMIGNGTAKVKIEVVSIPPGRENNYFSPRYTVQVGSFSDRENALYVKRKLDRSMEDVRVESINVEGAKFHRVRVGRFPKKSEAERVAGKLRRAGFYGRVILE